MHSGGERAAVRRMGFAYQIDDGRLAISVLLEDCRLASRGVRHHLPPIVLHELLCDGVRGQLQGLAGVVALLDAQNRQRQQQRELVRRGEQALIQQPLDVHHKPDLFVGRRRHLATVFQYGRFRSGWGRT